ncbi:MAG: signal peptidase I [Armatimonadetes bacterium]|nr:signal peptidase I [Armatimonadota bacterium]MDW8121992.1 signal peptidase I [Armatimonadota bacterium]
MPFAWDSVWGYLIITGILILLLLMRWVLQVEQWEDDRLRKTLIEASDSLAVALALVFFLIRPFVVHAFLIPSSSMEPTLLVQDRLLVNKFLYLIRPPRRQEVAVFRAPDLALQKSGHPDQKEYIKRIIGLPGDLVRLDERGTWVNGQLLEEPYVKDTASSTPFLRTFPDDYLHDVPWIDTYRHLIENHYGRLWVRVPEGHYFVLGDNRYNSLDSREWGFVPASSLSGKALVRFWPLRRINLIR